MTTRDDELVNELVGGDGEGRVLIAWILEAKYVSPGDIVAVVGTCSDNMDFVTQLGLAHCAVSSANERTAGTRGNDDA